ncbi:MAG TPA: hypothetical protein VFA65_10085 [Bryobacteraceae bacterium]|nr:hypothetical protein [Bryobacteraceae bacterium]
MSNRPLLLAAGAMMAFSAATPRDPLSSDDIKFLQDPGGWEYITVSDQDAGIQTQHTCFDGQPHPGQCSGKMTFTRAKTFVQQVSIHGATVSRRGTYKIEGDQLSFFDEFGTRDGPYAVQLNRELKTLVLSMPQVRLELELEKQYKDDREQKRPPHH